jgi:type III secretory pathway component EscS
VARHVKFHSVQLAANLFIAVIVSKKQALTQIDLKDEDLNEVLKIVKCLMLFAQIVVKIAKSPSNQEMVNLFSAVDVLKKMKDLNQEVLTAHVFPPEVDPPWEEKAEMKIMADQMINQTTKHNLKH